MDIYYNRRIYFWHMAKKKKKNLTCTITVCHVALSSQHCVSLFYALSKGNVSPLCVSSMFFFFFWETNTQAQGRHKGEGKGF